MQALLALITKYLPQISSLISKIIEYFTRSPERKEELRKREEVKAKIEAFLAKHKKPQ